MKMSPKLLALGLLLAGSLLVGATIGRDRLGGLVGKGVFVRSLEHAGGVQATVDTLVELGCQWCALETMHQHELTTQFLAVDELPEFVRLCAAKEIAVWIWAYSRPGERRIVDLVDDFRARLVEAPGVAGIAVNCEEEWIGGDRDADARRLVAEVEAVADGRPLALTTYGGGPPNVPEFPWSAFAGRGWVGWPQVYDIHNDLGPDYPRRAVEAWREAGFAELVVFWGASDSRSVERMRQISSSTPSVVAVGWWDLYWLLRGDMAGRARRKFVTDFPRGTEFEFA